VLNALRIDPINSEALQLADSIAELEDNLRETQTAKTQSPLVVPTDSLPRNSNNLSESENYKSLGNDAVKRSDFQEAARLYAKAIELNPENIAAIGNRAQVYLKLCRFVDAEKDATKVLTLLEDPKIKSNVPETEIVSLKSKALFRRGLARRSIGSSSELDKALADFTALITLDPVNKAAITEKTRTEQLIKESKKVKSLHNSSKPPVHSVSVSDSNTSFLSEIKTVRKSKPAQENEIASTTKDSNPKVSEDISPIKKSSQTSGSATKKQQKALSIAPIVPNELPKNVYELERIWRGLKSHPELFASYLKGFKTSTFKKVFNENVSSDLMSSLFKATKDYICRDNPESAYKIIDGMTQMSKFKLTASLLPESDLKCVKEIILDISSCEKFSKEKISELLDKYKL